MSHNTLTSVCWPLNFSQCINIMISEFFMHCYSMPYIYPVIYGTWGQSIKYTGTFSRWRSPAPVHVITSILSVADTRCVKDLITKLIDWPSTGEENKWQLIKCTLYMYLSRPLDTSDNWYRKTLYSRTTLIDMCQLRFLSENQ